MQFIKSFNGVKTILSIVLVILAIALGKWFLGVSFALIFITIALWVDATYYAIKNKLTKK